MFFGFVMLVSGQKSRPPSTAPLNPEYVKAINTKGPDILETEWHLPYTPSFSALANSSQQQLRTSLPAAYDMRTAGPGGTPLVTPIKNQGSCGSCWAFSSLGSMESTWMLKGYGEYDLSENNVKNCHGFSALPCGYGSNFHPTAMFARGQGPYLEADDPYSVSNGTCITGLSPVKLLSQVLYIPPDVDAIKQTIYEHGGVSMPMRLNTGYYYNTDDYTHLNTITTSTNHLVALVGWDDNKKITGGLISAYPGPGAFIAKNSYGTGFGESGYFYISYHDIQVLDYGVCWPGWEEYIPGTEVHTRSRLGSVSSIGYDDPTGYGLIRINIGADEQLVKLGTYINAAMAEVSFEIYDDFDTANLVLSNKLLEHNNEYCHYPGYYSFELPVSMSFANSNEVFVKIKYYNPGYPWPIPIEAYIEDFMDPIIDTKACWVSGDGADGSWYLLGDDINYKYDLCAYLYTESSTSWHGTTSTAWDNASNWSNGIPDSNIHAIIPDTTNQPIISGSTQCRGMHIASGADLTISPSGSLSIDHELQLEGNLINSGSLAIASDANILYKGGAAQQVDASISGAENLTINNSSGVSLNNNLCIGNMLVLKAGSITPGEYSISYSDDAALEYAGQIVQTTSDAEFPTTNGPSILHIFSPAGVNLHAARSIDSTLILEAGCLNNSSNNISLAAKQKIVRYSGSLSASPVFGSSIDLDYRSQSSITTGNEVPASSSVVQKVLINCPDTVTLNSNLTINESLELNLGLFSNTSTLSIASGTQIIKRSGKLSSAPTFNSNVDLFYLGEIADTTGSELPTSSTVLRDLTMRNAEGLLLNANATVNQNLYLIAGTLNNTSNTLTLANNANIIVNPGLMDGYNGYPGRLSRKPTVGANVNLEYSGRYLYSVGVEMPDSADGTLNNLTINNIVRLTLTKNIKAKGNVEALGRIYMDTYCISGPGNLHIKRAATICTRHPNGIDHSNGSFQLSGTCMYNDTIDFRFEGANAQYMGINIPSVMRNLYINNSSTGGVTLRSKNIRIMWNMYLEANSIFTLENARTLFND